MLQVERPVGAFSELRPVTDTASGECGPTRASALPYCAFILHACTQHRGKPRKSSPPSAHHRVAARACPTQHKQPITDTLPKRASAVKRQCRGRRDAPLPQCSHWLISVRARAAAPTSHTTSTELSRRPPIFFTTRRYGCRVGHVKVSARAWGLSVQGRAPSAPRATTTPRFARSPTCTTRCSAGTSCNHALQASLARRRPCRREQCQRRVLRHCRLEQVRLWCARYHGGPVHGVGLLLGRVGHRGRAMVLLQRRACLVLRDHQHLHGGFLG